MKVAIITGASGGLGLELFLECSSYFPEIDEYWLISRNDEKLRSAENKSGNKCLIIPLDLTEKLSFATLSNKLEAAASDPSFEVSLLINNAGAGYLGNISDTDIDKLDTMLHLNVRAMTDVTRITLPYMKSGSHIINTSSIASFCPNTGLSVYSATKAYVSFFSRALGVELKERGISVCAVCPGPMHTNFTTRGEINGNSKMFARLPYCDVKKTARGALKAAKRGKRVYTPSVFYKFFRILAKLVPQRIMVRFTSAW
ncbi:MAG: SDR family NAD(P)-dependent oxidoreductase [Clostridiales bacterium]|nr:SDR family NAD(P)-dependent oxidoreductase [Clostridiales bacterium]